MIPLLPPVCVWLGGWEVIPAVCREKGLATREHGLEVPWNTAFEGRALAGQVHTSRDCEQISWD